MDDLIIDNEQIDIEYIYGKRGPGRACDSEELWNCKYCPWFRDDLGCQGCTGNPDD